MTGLLTRASPQTLRLVALALALLATVLFFATQIEGYLAPRMFNRITTSAAVVLPLAVGQAIVVMTRNIDLSVGSILGVVAYVVGDTLGSMPGLHPVLVVAYCMALGAVLGAVNGVLVAWGRVPSIIVTLGTLALYRTFLVEWSDARTITTAGLPQWIVDLPQATAFSLGALEVRVTVVLAVGACLLAGAALAFLRPARRFYAVGSNPDAAAIAGINAARVVFLAFVISGAMAGLSGFLFLAKFGNITVVAGLGMELKSVAAVVVGGVSIMGGSGSMLGVLMGALLVDTIDNSLTRWEVVSEFWRDALLGFLIMAAVTLDTLAARSLARLRRGGGA
ncbi:MAG: ABC transporter permease [Fuscovulum sp.]|nr:ABC transporter permease [Fuscovulum sp.]